MTTHYRPLPPTTAHYRAAASLLLLSTACAGATLGSGVGDAILDRPPYYAGRPVVADAACVAHLPVAYQPGASQSPIFDPRPGEGTPVAGLLAEINAYLDALGATTRIASSGTPAGTPPDVRFGCETDASGDCMGDVESRDVRHPDLTLAVGRPSGAWVTWLSGALRASGATRALVLTLEVGQYWPRQRNLRGDKEVELGTGHTAPIPWLTSLETPVSVLQLTGAVVDSAGKALRIGAEGLLARRTELLISAVGGQRLITEGDVQQLRTARRDDLPGRPLVWQAALGTLVTQLAGGSSCGGNGR